jgi:hypothetical protein
LYLGLFERVEQWSTVVTESTWWLLQSSLADVGETVSVDIVLALHESNYVTHGNGTANHCGTKYNNNNNNNNIY